MYDINAMNDVYFFLIISYIFNIIFIYFKDPNPDPDIRRILQFLEGYPTSGYPKTPDPDKDSKIMDPPDKDSDPDTLKLLGYPIRSVSGLALTRFYLLFFPFFYLLKKGKSLIILAK